MMRKPWTYFHAQYDLTTGAGGRSLGCTESYPWFSPAALANELDTAIRNGDWLVPYFHNIGRGGLAITEQAFAEVIHAVAARRDAIWCAGMSRVQRYRTERDAAHLAAYAAGDDIVVLRPVCTTDAGLHDQPLSLELTLPPAIGVKVTKTDGTEVPHTIREERRRRVIFSVPPVDGVYEVRGVGLGTAWRAEHGPDIAVPSGHPHLFFTADELAALKTKQERPIVRDMWKRLQDRVAAIQQRRPPQPDRSESSWEKARTAAENLRALAFAYVMTGEAAYVTRALSEIEVVLAATSWSDPRHKAVADLVSAEIAWSLALGYDWMYQGLGEQDRRRLREAIVHRGLEPIYEATAQGVWWAKWPRGNWGAVILGKAGTAAIALLADEPRAAEWVRISRDKLWHYCAALGPDGGWGEGISYGAYCWFNVFKTQRQPMSPCWLRSSSTHGCFPNRWLSPASANRLRPPRPTRSSSCVPPRPRPERPFWWPSTCAR